MRASPIVDKVIKDYCGRTVNFVKRPSFSFGKELQLHVMEVKPDKPFESPETFEENMHRALLEISERLNRKYRLNLLGTGMHPLLRLNETGIWPHRHKKIYDAFSEIFDLQRHGWLNIQSYQLNLPYSNEKQGIFLHNALANIVAYIPAIASSSPMCEGEIGPYVDNRLNFYKQSQREIPSITGDVIPEYVNSFSEYQSKIIEKYSSEMAKAGAQSFILGKDWINSRGVVFRFDRKALEIRVMDEQECVKSDVALSCYARAVARGFLKDPSILVSHQVLVKDFNAIVAKGLEAGTSSAYGKTARQVCLYLLSVAKDNSTNDERKYLDLIRKRIDGGNLSETIRKRICKRAQKTDFREATIEVYGQLTKSLIKNEPYL